MSEWIESHVSLPRHRKTKRLAKRLNLSIPLTLGYMHMLWYYAADFAPGGNLTGHLPEDIANGCDWEGDAGEFLEAFVYAGWIDRHGDELTLHDWEDCNRQYRERQKAAERQAAKRARGKALANSNVDVTVTSRATDRQTGQTRQTDRQTDTPAHAREAALLPVDKSPREEATLEVLRAIPTYPFNESEDLALLREPRDPRVDTAKQARKYRDFWNPKWAAWKKKDPPNPRLAWRNWLEKAEEICRKDSGPLRTTDTSKPPDEPMTKAQEAEALEAAAEGRRMIANLAASKTMDVSKPAPARRGMQ